MTVKPLQFKFAERQNKYFKAKDLAADASLSIPQKDTELLTKIDIIYRALCAILYNYAPLSGHPGGSISSGRIVSNLFYNMMDYDFNNPDDISADMISYAAGHKALGLYAASALRNEIVKQYKPELLPSEKRQLRLEDLLGFRKSKASETKLFKKFNAKALDGHPVPITPFIKLATGASGVGFASSVGLAAAAADVFKQNPPKVNIIEGEGGLTSGRCAEALAIAATSGLDNLIIHLDWNQASIESNKVTAEDGVKGDYVCWTPAELFYTQGCNVIEVDEGFDFAEIYAAQKFAASLNNGRPTAIVYRTVKGWKYGLEGKASHGGGHKFASEEFYAVLSELESAFNVQMPHFCGTQTPDAIEECYYMNLLTIRNLIAEHKDIFAPAAEKIAQSAQRLKNAQRSQTIFKTEAVYTQFEPAAIPPQFAFTADKTPTLRGVMSDCMGFMNKETGGAFLVSTADLGGSTGATGIVKGFGEGFYNKQTNPQSRLLPSGGICEDGLSGVMSGISAYGKHIGVAASYAAFTAPMMHTAARLYAIGEQCLHEATAKPFNTFVIFCGHAGMPTGEDGPTHADPQSLQLIMDNFPKGFAITLTPLDANDIWSSLAAAFKHRPAVLYPVVTRPNVKIIDRQALGADSAVKAAQGVYALSRSANKEADGVIIVQGSGAGEIFANQVLPKLKEEGLQINAYYIASLELFNLLTDEEKEKILPAADLKRAIAITDFTLPTMQCWLKSQKGAAYSIYPFKGGLYMTSGKASDVYKEAGMDAEGQLKSIKEYLAEVKKDWY